MPINLNMEVQFLYIQAEERTLNIFKYEYVKLLITMRNINVYMYIIKTT